MLLIFKGDVPTGTLAGDLQASIEATVLCEHDDTVQHTKDGCQHIQFETFRPPGAKLLLSDGSEVEVIEPEIKRAIGLTLHPAPRSVRFSPALAGMSVDNFPPEHTFGNGLTAGSTVSIDGELVRVSWVVLPMGTVLTDAQYEAIRLIMEGA